MRVVRTGKNKYRRYGLKDYLKEYRYHIGCVIVGGLNVYVLALIISQVMEVL